MSHSSDDSDEYENQCKIINLVDKHVTRFLDMIDDPENEIFFYTIKDKVVYKKCCRVLTKFFSERKDKNSFTTLKKQTLCYYRDHDIPS